MKRMTAAGFRGASSDRGVFDGMALVREIVAGVRSGGDAAVREYTRRFDRAGIDSPAVGPDRIAAASDRADTGLVDALYESAENLDRFARAQLSGFRSFEVEIRPGVFAGQAVIPLARVGVYVPGGRYPLVSSLLMGAVPARAAGVGEIVVCTPPDAAGNVPDAILVAADMCGVREVFRIGGAQAVAAMAYGTESVPRVDKIVGPGNEYVTAAKQCVAGDVGIDFVAGPTELLVVADDGANPVLIAADLIAQAEHDVRATPILITDSPGLAARVEEEIERLLGTVGTRDVARAALDAGGIIVVASSIAEALELADARAPEHLGLFTRDAKETAPRLHNYGSLFVGESAAEAFGDYSSGLNHVLPTRGAARYTGGLSVRDFLKFQTILRIEEGGAGAIGPAAAKLARAEGLDGHALSVELRSARRGRSLP
jgi:histidinol dehydrogenase